MRALLVFRGLVFRWFVCLWLAWLPLAAVGAEAPAVVYGVEFDLRGEHERVLVFASRPVEPTVTEGEDGRVMLVLSHAVLDASAPRELQPEAAGNVRRVDVREVRAAAGPHVELRIRRRADAAYEVEARGATLAVTFERLAPLAEDVVLAFEDAPLAKIVERVAALTGERFVFDAELEGNASIVLAQPITAAAAVTLLDSLLHLSGYAAVPTPGGVRRIVKLADAQALAPLHDASAIGAGDAPVATAVHLRGAAAEEVAQQLAPWIGSQAQVVAHAPSGTLIVSGAESHVRSLLRLVEAVDVGAGGEIWVRRLRHRDSREIVAQLQAVLAGRPGRASRAVISADARARSLVVVAPEEELLEIRGLVAQLDRRVPAEGAFHVRRLRYADPEAMAALLGRLAAGNEPSADARANALAGSAMRVAVDHQSGALLVMADAATYEQVAALLDELDRPPPRIEVEVTLLEVLTSEGVSLGFDAFIPARFGSTGGVAALLNPSGGGLFQPGAQGGPDFAARFSRSPVSVPVLGPLGNIISVLVPRESFVLTADESFVASRVLQKPHLTLLAGQEQEIFAGDNIPVPVASETASLDPLSTSLDIQRYDVGVSLRARASVGEAGRVRLELDIENSRVAASAGRAATTNTGPVIETRELSTVVWLDDSVPALVGGAEVAEMSLQNIGVPWLRDVPLLGALVRSTQERRVKVQLVVAAQVHVQRDAADAAAASIRRRLGFERALARTETLAVGAAPSWALRVATRSRADDATAIAAHFDLAGETADVAAWAGARGERHDVVLSGYASLAELSRAAERARAAGFTPELISVPAAKE